MSFCKWLSKNVLKPNSKNVEIGRFNRSSLIESFKLTLKVHSFVPSNMHAEFSFTRNIYCLIRIQDIFSAVIDIIKTKINLLKLWILIQQYTATDFQGWSEMTLKIKSAYFCIFRNGF